MSQHDFDISTLDANTGVAFRAAVNAALQALASTSSGPTEPSTSWAGMLWFDTTTDKLKVRDSTNTTWNEIWDIGGTCTAFAYTLLDDTTAAQARATIGAPPTGSVVLWTTDTAPSGWLLCYGQAVSRTTYADLFAIIGTTYGVGDTTTTFNVPDLRGRFPLGKDNMGGSSANRVTDTDADTLGGADGDETKDLSHTHTGPSHTHGGALSAGGHSITGPSTTDGEVRISGGGESHYKYNGTDLSVATSASGTGATGSAGSATQDIMPPFLTMNYIIKT